MLNIIVVVRVISLCLLLCTQFAWSADVPVTSDADSGPGTLREALADANNGDTIVFALPTGSIITLASTLTVAKSLAIDGAGSSGLTINGNHAVDVLTISGGVSATISNLAVANGTAGIFALGNLTVSKCNISGSTHGIYNYGTLIVANSTFFGNSTSFVGGGIYIYYGSATITNSTFVSNSALRGGAIENNSNSISTVTNSLFQGNSASQFGAAIYDFYGGKVYGEHNLYWSNNDPNGEYCSGCSIDSNIVLADPLLGSFADNGGPTQTYLPALGGAAIDSGDDTACATPAVNNLDQRGVVRPTGAHCDIGAVENNDRVFLDDFEPAI